VCLLGEISELEVTNYVDFGDELFAARMKAAICVVNVLHIGASCREMLTLWSAVWHEGEIDSPFLSLDCKKAVHLEPKSLYNLASSVPGWRNW
jgi:hypothetical protein